VTGGGETNAMCTLSIWRAVGGADGADGAEGAKGAEGGGYRLWFNRDEKYARAAEAAPCAGETDEGVRYFAPRDGERGGTWLLLNEHGVTICVLNDYEAAAREGAGGGAAAGRVSRGRLPLAGAGAAGAAEAVRRVAEFVASESEGGAGRFAPFRVVAVDAGGVARGLRWDGRALAEVDEVEFATSSSFRPGEIRARREERHAELGAKGARGAGELEKLHWAHEAGSGAESVLMRREDACTRSVCAVTVRAGAGRPEASLRYTAVDWAGAGGGRAGASVEAGW
jgi:Transport and Golgi organisation 2